MKTYRSFKEELLKEKTIKLVDTKESKKLLLALYTKKFYLDNEKEINEHEEQIKETRKRYRNVSLFTCVHENKYILIIAADAEKYDKD